MSSFHDVLYMPGSTLFSQSVNIHTLGVLQKYLDFWTNRYTTDLTCSMISDKIIYQFPWVSFNNNHS